MTTINISHETEQKFELTNLEAFINGEDFEDLVFWYQILKWKTWRTQSFSSFKDELWL